MRLDPLVAIDDPTKPLRSRLLQVPSLRAQYLAHVKAIAEHWLDWENLGPVVSGYRDLLDAEVKADTRKLSSYEAFTRALDPEDPGAPADGGRDGARDDGGARGPIPMSLKRFARERREFLLKHPEIAGLK